MSNTTMNTMPVRLDIKGEDVVHLAVLLGQCFDWMESKNVHMHVWKTDLTIEKLEDATNELRVRLVIAKDYVEDAEHNGWPLDKEWVVEWNLWTLQGWNYIGRARADIEEYNKLMAATTGSVLHWPCETLSCRTLNCRAIQRVNNILKHMHKGKEYHAPWKLWPKQDNREEQRPSSDDCAREEPFATPSSNESLAPTSGIQKMKLSGLAKYHAIPRDKSHDRVPVMIQVNAPATYTRRSRAAIDLVMVLDARKRMMDYDKLDQLKQGCMFVILNLEARDRLSIVTFGKTKELLPLTSMSTDGKTLANKLVSSLQAAGATTAGPAMDRAYKILDDRQDRNPVSSILLLTDGQNKRIFNESSRSANGEAPPKRRKYPTYTFGFGLDHDPRTLYYLATSGYGTYSYVTDNKSIRDAMALCIGGLTSIVAQDLQITIQSAREDVKIQAIMSGGYHSAWHPGVGSIDVKDIYADEEKRFIVYVSVPREEEAAAIFLPRTPKTKLLSITATYYCPLTRTEVSTDTMVVSVERPRKLQGRNRGISVEVAGELTRADMFNRVEDEWDLSTYRMDYLPKKGLRMAFAQLCVKLNDLKKSIDSTEEAHVARERWDDLVMDLENMKKDISDIDRISIETGIDLYSSSIDLYSSSIDPYSFGIDPYSNTGRYSSRITGLPYMLSWLSSHRWQRAATPGSISKSHWFHFRTTRMENMVDSVDIAPIDL